MKSSFITFPVVLDFQFDPTDNRFNQKVKKAISVYDSWRQLTRSVEHKMNYGIRTGRISNLTVLDFAFNSPAYDIVQAKRLYTVDTPSRGMHYYFQYEASLDSIYNTFPGVSVMNDNRFVFAGHNYRPHDDECPISVMPPNLVDLLRRQQSIVKPIHQKCYDLFNVLPDEWFHERELYMKLVHVLRNSTVTADRQIETMRRLLVDRFGYYCDRKLMHEFSLAMNYKQQRFVFATLIKRMKVDHPDEYNEWLNSQTSKKSLLNEQPLKTRMVYQRGSLVKFSDLKAIQCDLTTAKLSEMNSEYTVVTKKICKLCRNRHLVGCCNGYQRKAYTNCKFVNNIELV